MTSAKGCSPHFQYGAFRKEATFSFALPSPLSHLHTSSFGKTSQCLCSFSLQRPTVCFLNQAQQHVKDHTASQCTSLSLQIAGMVSKNSGTVDMTAMRSRAYYMQATWWMAVIHAQCQGFITCVADGDQVCRHWSSSSRSYHPSPMVIQTGGRVLQTGTEPGLSASSSCH